MDGVLANFVDHIWHTFQPENSHRSIEKIWPVTITTFLGLPGYNHILRATALRGWWLKIPPYPHTLAILARMMVWRDEGYNVSFLTHPAPNKGCKPEKILWLHEYWLKAVDMVQDPNSIEGEEGVEFDDYSIPEIHFSEGSKGDFASPSSALIDDNFRNCRDFEEAGGKAFLFPAASNCQYEEVPNALGLLDNFIYTLNDEK